MSFSLTPHSDALFLLQATILGFVVWITATLWSKWDMRRAVRKEVKRFVEQEAALKRLTGD